MSPSNSGLLGTTDNESFSFITNGTVRGAIGASGAWSIAATSSGVALTVNGSTAGGISVTGVTSTGIAVSLSGSGSAITASSVGATTTAYISNTSNGTVLEAYSGGGSGVAFVAYAAGNNAIQATNFSSTIPTLTVQNNTPNGPGQTITVAGTGTGLEITAATGTGVDISCSGGANALTASNSGAGATGFFENTGSGPALTVEGQGASVPAMDVVNFFADGPGVTITVSGTGTGLAISAATGTGVSAVCSGNANAIFAQSTGSSATVDVQQFSTGNGIAVIASTGHGIDISVTTGTGVYSVCSGSGNAIYANSSGAAATVDVQQTGAGTGIAVTGSTGNGISVNTTTGVGVNIAVSGNGSAITTSNSGASDNIFAYNNGSGTAVHADTAGGSGVAVVAVANGNYAINAQNNANIASIYGGNLAAGAGVQADTTIGSGHTALVVTASTNSSSIYAATISNNAGKGASGLEIIAGDPANTAGDTFIEFSTTSSFRGSITQTSTGVAYNLMSDEDLKEEIRVADGALAKVLGVDTFSFLWKGAADREPEIGYVAQRLQKQMPKLVTPGTELISHVRDTHGNLMFKDKEQKIPVTKPRKIPWQVNPTGMIPYLHAAFKEYVVATEARIAALETKLAAAKI